MAAQRPAARAFLRDVFGVLFVWALLVTLESLLVGALHNAEFSGSWEMAHARWALAPVALTALAPAAVLAVLVARLVTGGRHRAVAALGLVAGAALGVGVTNGRHFENLALRVPFVSVVALAVATAAWIASRRRPRRPDVLATLGVIGAALAWFADGKVLPRLYPAFHTALLVLMLASFALVWPALRGGKRGRVLATAGLVLVLVCALRAPSGARQVATDDNLRRVLVEHAPILGRAVLVASVVEPPPALDDGNETDASTQAVMDAVKGAGKKAEAPRLDWSGRDVVLLTVDALRADHVSSYGYPRPTTPNMDALARRGARFTHAYCPTPHTSYSITSLMTGKYMRPLLGMGAGEDSETWADHLKRYGYRTAAFYPPAVFFIDAHRFTALRDRSLGFEYKKEEFAAPELRGSQIEHYLSKARTDKPLFLWLHVFEPHEPYEMHDEHPFEGQPRVDAYDSEIATADALLGDVVRLVEARRPGAVVIFSADHGEEFDDHGGRYHGSTVYEEQVRVPLVIVGPGVAPQVVETPVQTIDLLPTTLAAQGIPLPARIRGRDLAPLVTGDPAADRQGLAFAETDDYTMVARGTDRLICERQAAACSLFDLARDPSERVASADRPERVRELKKLTAAIERENGRLEASGIPEALRRGLQGDRDAAEDVQPLFDDARVDIRRAAAECAFRLRAPVMEPQLRRAAKADEDSLVRRWAVLALARSRGGQELDGGATPEPLPAEETQRVRALLADEEPRIRGAAALTLAEFGDRAGEELLVQRWTEAFGPDARTAGEELEGRELLEALSRIRARSAVPVLGRSLATDVRLRPFIATALGRIGDARAVKPLLAAFAEERYLHVRPREAEALLALGAREELRAPLTRFAGVVDPMHESLDLARAAGLLVPAKGGLVGTGEPRVEFEARLAGEGPARVWVHTAPGDGTAPSIQVAGAAALPVAHDGAWIAELTDAPGSRVAVRVEDPQGVRAVWLVRRAPEVPPPAPQAWQPDRSGGSDELLEDGGL